MIDLDLAAGVADGEHVLYGGVRGDADGSGRGEVQAYLHAAP